MLYSKVETYVFSMPKEYKAYLQFRDDLKASSVRFLDEGGHEHQTITIRTHGHFDKTEDISN